ncbi:tyrosine-type recombinase/integrase [Roseateles sp. P5_E11]
MPTNTLTDAKCRAIKPGAKLIKTYDGGGLHLATTPHGAKVWRVAFRLDGKPQTKSLGPYPEVSLAEAREKRDALKKTLRDGADPRAPKKAKAGMLFKPACEAYWNGRRDIADSYRDNVLRCLEFNLWPKLGARPIGEITRDELLDTLRPMDAAGKHSYVRKARMWAGQVFEWAVENREATINPAAQIRPEKAFGKSPVTHFAALDIPDVPDFLERLGMENRDLQSVFACWMLAYTWVRTSELRMMEWSEVDGAMWRLPAGKMKRPRDHLVPLPTQAQALLKELKPRCRGARFVFEGDRTPDKPMSENNVLALIARIGYKGRMTGHGWRSVASSWANERGYNPDAIERQLAHVPKDETRAAYNRAAYLPERTRMLQEWANWLESVKAG